jgi:hypothetical protein
MQYPITRVLQGFSSRSPNKHLIDYNRSDDYRLVSDYAKSCRVRELLVISLFITVGYLPGQGVWSDGVA